MKSIQNKLLLIALIFHASSISVFSQTDNNNSNSIILNIRGIESNKGVIRVFLFNSEETFLKETYKVLVVDIKDKDSVIINFDSIPTGTYAINVYHDKNNNKELDTNFFRIPKEPYGFSNNIRGSMGPPKFQDVKFMVEKTNVSLTTFIK